MPHHARLFQQTAGALTTPERIIVPDRVTRVGCVGRGPLQFLETTVEVNIRQRGASTSAAATRGSTAPEWSS